jgi:hypothetical protein
MGQLMYNMEQPDSINKNNLDKNNLNKEEEKEKNSSEKNNIREEEKNMNNTQEKIEQNSNININKLYQEDLSKNNSQEINNNQIKKPKLAKTKFHSSENLSSLNTNIEDKELINNEINEGNFSDQERKSSNPIIKNNIISNYDNSDSEEEEKKPIFRDINFDIKKVFKMKPIHEEYNEEELNKLSNKNKMEKNDYEFQFYRNGENIRNTYIAKLIYKQIWKPSVEIKTHNSLIIFDWDDTLLCTTFLTPKGYFDEDIVLNEKEKEKVQKLEISVYNLLKICIDKGDVYIITNAGPGWVEFSAEKFYPNILKLLKKIKIISARGEYEEKYPNDSRQWKIETFLNLKNNLDMNLVTNIICCGDSVFEMEAGKILASKFEQAFIKTIKFRESPKPEELNKQLRLVIDQFNGIYSAVKNLTIRVEKKKK